MLWNVTTKSYRHSLTLSNLLLLCTIMQDAGAMYYLGICHERGLGTGRNEARAAVLYRNAASQRHPSALYNLAVFFEHGIGGTITPHPALHILTLSLLSTERNVWYSLLYVKHFEEMIIVMIINMYTFVYCTLIRRILMCSVKCTLNVLTRLAFTTVCTAQHNASNTRTHLFSPSLKSLHVVNYMTI